MFALRACVPSSSVSSLLFVRPLSSLHQLVCAPCVGPQRWPAGFHLTEPILHVDRRAMVRKETRTSRPTFSIFQPFERNLWLAIVGAIVVAAGVFFVLDLLWHEETPSSHSFLYHAAALLLTRGKLLPQGADFLLGQPPADEELALLQRGGQELALAARKLVR